MAQPIVFFDIVGTELPGQAAFYKAIFDWDSGPGGQLNVPVTSPLMGVLRTEAPQPGGVAERVLYIGVLNVNATLAAITEHGGAVVFPRLEVKGVAVIAMFTDPAGNRMGLVELDGERAKVP
jgi:predicted enzyme related to lactoylglutathione lyase